MAAIALALTAIAPRTASADLSLNMNGTTNEFSQSGATFTGNISVLFADAGPGQVTLTIDTNGVTGPSGLKLTEFSFNITGFDPASIGVAVGSPTNATVTDIDQEANAFKADGDGFFDFLIEFDNSGNTFTLGEKATFNLSATGLTSAAFNSVSVNGPVDKTGFIVAAHLQSITGGSGWFNGTPVAPQAVPEPSTIAMVALSLVPLGIRALRRARRRPTTDRV